ncbi:MAG: DUF2723 domain-containing protein [Anaerolineaceae bacterium]|nr:DUF2723 domain-containing protein [Anaerolineaceae bacterium]
MPNLSRTQLIGGTALAVLLVAYLSTLQTIPNGAEHYYMIDVGETQIVLNTWGTLHATGYPLYVMTGNLLVILLRGLGIPAVTAPALVSLLWGLAALVLFYVLANHLTRRPWLSAGIVVLLGLTRTVWIHQDIAEIYTFGLFLLALLLALALWKRPVHGRIYWLALVGGIGVFHHRALLMAAPALLFAVWPELAARDSVTKSWLAVVRRIVISLLIGLLGFLPYLYLPLRATAGAKWVYGQPGTWAGFWDQFMGREAERFIGAPDSLAGLVANLNTVNTVLLTDLTLPGLLLGILGLLLALWNPSRRRMAVAFLLNGGVAYAFHVLLYTDIMSALILPVLVSVAFGWLFLGEIVLTSPLPNLRFSRPSPNGEGKTNAASRGEVGGRAEARPYTLSVSLILVALLFGAALWGQNQPFIHDLTTNPTGLDTIALVGNAPPGATVMLAWGPRYFAASFAHDVAGELSNIHLVDHRADFPAILQTGILLTPEYTFYNQPVSWWEAKLGTPVYLHTAAPDLVQIPTQPETATDLPDGISVLDESVTCTESRIILRVAWATKDRPAQDWSVFVHLLDSSGNVIAQGDQSAPVYGWRPLATWIAGEVVRDMYIIPRAAGSPLLRYGLYHQLPSGEFVNEIERELAVGCNVS